MIHILDQVDKAAFQYLNLAGNAFWDDVMIVLSSKTFWIPFYVLIIFLAYRKGGWKSALGLLVMAGIAVGLSDQTASGLLKPLIERYRPCRTEVALSFPVYTVEGECGGPYGFVSSHAANFFAMATLFTLFFSRRLYTFLFYFVAALVAYSRIYLGVHYPGDVLVGGLIGSFWGWGVYQLSRRVARF